MSFFWFRFGSVLAKMTGVVELEVVGGTRVLCSTELEISDPSEGLDMQVGVAEKLGNWVISSVFEVGGKVVETWKCGGFLAIGGVFLSVFWLRYVLKPGEQ